MSGLTREERDLTLARTNGCDCNLCIGLRRYESALTECESERDEARCAASEANRAWVKELHRADTTLSRLATLEAEAKVGREAVRAWEWMATNSHSVKTHWDGCRNAGFEVRAVDGSLVGEPWRDSSGVLWGQPTPLAAVLTAMGGEP